MMADTMRGTVPDTMAGMVAGMMTAPGQDREAG
jgi:hypothetical protein